MLKLQILSSYFRLLQIRGNWQFVSVVDGIASAEEDNTDTTTAAEEEEELWQTDLKRQMEAAAEADKIS